MKRTVKTLSWSLLFCLVVSFSVPGFVSVPEAHASKSGRVSIENLTVRVLQSLIYLDTVRWRLSVLNGYFFLPAIVNAEFCRSVLSNDKKEITVECENDQAQALPYEINVELQPDGATEPPKISWEYGSDNYPEDNSGTLTGDYTPPQPEGEVSSDTRESENNANGIAVADRMTIFEILGYVALIIIVVVILVYMIRRLKRN